MARRQRRGAAAWGSKRLIDLAVAGIGLIVLGPLMIAIAGLVWSTQGRPILFRQERAGLNGRPFTLIKFRTMRLPRGDELTLEADRRRLTRLGRLLRTTSLDELPELWNVLTGDMSMVGPRPLFMAYLDRYTPDEARRHDVRPGVTGWAVVNGRHTVAFERRLELDVWYVDNWSLSLDLRILATTVMQVLRREGVATVQTADEVDLPERFRLPAGAVPVGLETPRRPD